MVASRAFAYVRPQPDPAAERPSVIGSSLAFPKHRYAQDDLARLAAEVLPALQRREGFLERFFARVGVEERYLSLPVEDYARIDGFESRSRAWLDTALELSQRCIEDLLATTGVDPADVGEMITTTVTGLAVPSIDARLMNRIGFSPSMKRVPLFGLGCLAGAAGLARAADYLRGFPDQLCILLSVELCSLTLQRDDSSVANVISSGLFGDGAAAVLLAGHEHPLAGRAQPDVASPRVVDSRSVFFPNTERVMGWDMVDGGFKIVLSPEVPDVVRAHVPAALDGFLAEHELTRDDITAWVMHPGGPAVLDAVEQSLGLDPSALEPAREGLRTVGNLSSASVLYLLDRYRRDLRPPRGAWGILMAMGPAFCAEVVLLRW